MTEANNIDKDSWNGNKELSLMISCIKNSLWIENQEDFGNKYLIRELLQKCSGGNIVKMLKKILSGEEKTALVKNELDSFFQTQAQSFENHMKVKSEMLPSQSEIKTKYVDESEKIGNSYASERTVLIEENDLTMENETQLEQKDEFENQELNLIGERIRILYDQAWHIGTIDYFNTETIKYGVLFEDGSEDHISVDEIDGVNIILETEVKK